MGANLSAAPARAEAAPQPSGCPYQPDTATQASPPQQKPAGCPVDPSKWASWAGGSGPAEGERLNPFNMMPASNQQPAPGQSKPLSTDRVTSTIPQGSGGQTGRWVYPSEQMFYNALLRKGKGDGVDESAMPAVIAIHNNMNERGWKQVLEWEALRRDECPPDCISLLRFVGRPHELSPKARVKTALGLAPMPFDRHDWVIDRCGTEVRYIIDYYDASAKAKQDKVRPSAGLRLPIHGLGVPSHRQS
jgi:cytochrome c heme-lyase